MAVSKVVYGGRTLIDLTGDNITADKLKSGYTAHGADGEIAYVRGKKVTGTMKNNGASQGKISTKAAKYTIPQPLMWRVRPSPTRRPRNRSRGRRTDEQAEV